MSGNILCKLGIHKWGPWIIFTKTLSGMMANSPNIRINKEWVFEQKHRMCRRCGEEQDAKDKAYPVEDNVNGTKIKRYAP